jgi:hypothetical protein
MVDMNDSYQSTIINILKGKDCTTLELETKLSIQGIRCPDDLARTLNVMRRKGLINGKVSTERGGWVWWVEG